MQIADRVSLWGGKKSPLPPGARWVECLESTGTQYIDTGVDYFADFEITVKLRESVSNVTLISSDFNRLERNSASQPYWRFRSAIGGIYNTTISITELHTLAWKDNKVYSDGAFISNWSKDLPTGRMYVFGRPSTQYPAIVYALKLWDANGTLVRDFRPIAIGTTGYMLDLVSGEHLPYGNKGTGDFIVGPDAPATTGGGGISAYA